MTSIFLLGFALLTQTSTPPQKAEVVSVTGCLKQSGTNEWNLITATDPAPSRATAPAPNQIPANPPTGKNQFKLIGVSEFNLEAKKDQTVIVKGLFVKATPVNRLNITSVTTVAPTCPPVK